MNIQQTGYQSTNNLNLYPNPYIDSIIIEFGSEFEIHVTMTINDQQDSFVTRLLNQNLTNDKQQLEWKR